MREFIKLFETDEAPEFAADKYPELQEIAMRLANEVSAKINEEARNVESKMPYKAQCILELMIDILNGRV